MVYVKITNIGRTVEVVNPITTCDDLRDKYNIASMWPNAYGKSYDASTTMRTIARDNGIDLDTGTIILQFKSILSDGCTIM